MMQHSFFLCKCLHPADVGAVSDRPRAWCSAQRIEISILAGGKYTLIHDNRPYEFYCRFCVFCNTPIRIGHRLCKTPLCPLGRGVLISVYSALYATVSLYILWYAALEPQARIR